MTVIAVISPKGGVGKTTLTVSLACSLGFGAHACHLIDLDSQNAMRLHLGAVPGDADGLIHQTLMQQSWCDAEYDSAYGVSFVPYGRASEIERISFEVQLAKIPFLLRKNLAELDRDPRALIFVDTPPGPSVYLQQVLSVANIVIVVMHPDAGSYVTLNSIEDLLDYYCANRTDFYGSYYVLNEFDATKSLNLDIQTVMQNNLGERLFPYAIHRDESLSEALAYQQPIWQYSPHSQAAEDLTKLSDWLKNIIDGVPR